MKMLDRISEIDLPNQHGIRGLKDNPIPIEITDVAKWIGKEGPQAPSELPTVVSPFERAWYEWTPQWVDADRRRKGLVRRIGVAAYTKKIEEHVDWREREIPAGVHWLTYYTAIAEYRGQHGFLTWFFTRCMMNEAGEVISGLQGYKPVAGELPPGVAARIMNPVFFAISLMHCKNTELVDIPIPPKVKQNRKRKGQHPGVEYKTLEIDPMKTQVRNEQAGDESEIDRALHICRGHFKDYRENGMFGKDSHKGVYWFEQHARGTKEAGEVRKDYEVKYHGRD